MNLQRRDVIIKELKRNEVKRETENTATIFKYEVLYLRYEALNLYQPTKSHAHSAASC